MEKKKIGSNNLLCPATPTTMLYLSRLRYTTKCADIVECIRLKTKYTLRVDRLEFHHSVKKPFVVGVPTDCLSTFKKEEF